MAWGDLRIFPRCLNILHAAAAQADGVIHLAFGKDFSSPTPLQRRSPRKVQPSRHAAHGSQSGHGGFAGLLNAGPESPATQTTAHSAGLQCTCSTRQSYPTLTTLVSRIR